ncbi:MAG: hypothetical protein IJD38_05685, partial [Clostridia bacterium]|nr:hypothetical protein [Clostridia bacterium]
FEQIIPPLTADEFAQLEDNILKLGRVTDSIKIWNGFIIDGHHRYKIIQKHPEISYTTDEMDFDSEYEAIAWMCNAQLGRRNITEANRQYLLGKRYAAEKEIRGGDRKSEDQKGLSHSLSEKLLTQPLFQRNSQTAEEIHLWWMKSSCEEIQLRRDMSSGFHVICNLIRL